MRRAPVGSEGDFFGVRLLENGYTGGVAQTPPVSPRNSFSGYISPYIPQAPTIPYGRPKTGEGLAPPVSIYATPSDAIMHAIPGVPYGRPKSSHSSDGPQFLASAIAGPSNSCPPPLRRVEVESANIGIIVTTSVDIAAPAMVVTQECETQALQVPHIIYESQAQHVNYPELSEKARGKQREMTSTNLTREEQQVSAAPSRKPLSTHTKSDSDLSMPSLEDSDDDDTASYTPPRTPSPEEPLQTPEKSATRQGRPKINFGSDWLRRKGRDHTDFASAL